MNKLFNIIYCIILCVLLWLLCSIVLDRAETEPAMAAVEYEAITFDMPYIEPLPSIEPTPTPEPTHIFTEADVIACAKMLYGEARGCSAEDQRNCVITVCNRVGTWADTPEAVVSQPCQYYGYSADNPVWDNLYDVAYQTLCDWEKHLNGEDVEWAEYRYFSGNGNYNVFR